ncbi:MAG TPA: hypothetical protein VFQ61_33280 [Polyangiaceae bacterium]|nr:hypothetical protein [Polyangiaceae bacterium]
MTNRNCGKVGVATRWGALARYAAALGMVSAVSACSAAPEAGEPNDAISETKQEIYSTYTWTQNGATQQMLPVSEGFCFITKITGKFRGDQEWVSLDHSSGFWTLSGHSNQHSVAVQAACVKYSELGASSGSVPYDTGWVSGYTWVLTDPNEFCYMTGFKGQADSYRDGVWVYPLPGSVPGYEIEAYHSGGNGIWGKMSCVRLADKNFLPFGSYQLSQKWTDFCTNNTSCYNSQTISSSQRFYCMLSQVQGQLRGSGEIASVVRNSDTNWTLNADSMRACSDGNCQLTTTATCNFY